MKKDGSIHLEELMFAYIDKIKYLISPELWSSEILNCSKNEVFILLLLYRRDNVNMSQIAEYLSVPLNTVTGIIARMEKKRLLYRTRSKEDKRVVTLEMSEQGKEQIKEIMQEILQYGNLILEHFTADEIELVFRLLDKVVDVLSKEQSKRLTKKPCKKTIRKITIE